ncbi:hypothetical protein [Candidatus Absconditicoccus praedator]|uniref:hypothetical protein n=1 Tax=Candidatus Absconditicoccus praedator TaxID=2735562 RepID=UPI001E32CF19|nr:hypothetical protein [Candidatus Absconditicoccus praedator]UFX82986.1 hypothetical protein HLG78_02525 [Candidatus Absconditicoccus praedator]
MKTKILKELYNENIPRFILINIEKELDSMNNYKLQNVFNNIDLIKDYIYSMLNKS